MQEEPEREEQVEEEVDNGEVLYSGNEEDEKDYYYKRAPIKVLQSSMYASALQFIYQIIIVFKS